MVSFPYCRLCHEVYQLLELSVTALYFHIVEEQECYWSFNLRLKNDTVLLPVPLGGVTSASFQQDTIQL